MNSTDFYQCDVESNVLEVRDKYISQRWQQLYNLLIDGVNKVINFLFMVNLAGSMMILIVMAVLDDASKSLVLRWSLFFYALGLVLIGILRAIIVHRAAFFFNKWRKDVERYHSEQISFVKLTANDDNRTRTDKIEFITGYASGLSFIIASILACIALFTIK